MIFARWGSATRSLFYIFWVFAFIVFWGCWVRAPICSLAEVASDNGCSGGRKDLAIMRDCVLIVQGTVPGIRRWRDDLMNFLSPDFGE